MAAALTRERFLRDAWPVRLGGIASNLSRARSFATHPELLDAVDRVLDETQSMIEWTGAEVPASVAPDLASLQEEVASWKLRLRAAWEEDAQRGAFGVWAAEWTQRVLEASGLLRPTA